MNAPLLNRLTWPHEAAPPRIVHLGLGGFHRAHQADYTDRATDAEGWGIAAFTGRTPDAAATLARQHGLFTLISRRGDFDEARIVSSLSAPLDGARTDVLTQLIAAPQTSIITLTVTESAYRLGPDGGVLVDDPAIAQDLSTLRAAIHDRAREYPRSINTPLVRMLAGLERRRRDEAGAIAIIPCDNLASGGPLVQRALIRLAEEMGPDLVEFVGTLVSVASTTVDRITPRTQQEDRLVAERLTGYIDASPVVAEPYSSWVISGSFPSGRPDWESAGVEFTDDIRPFEQRKLWMLNGAHSLLAYAGLVRGWATVAEAAEDEVIASWIDDLWCDAARSLDASFGQSSLLQFRASLQQRFLNSRMSDALTRIAADGIAKLRVRAVPLILAQRSQGSHALGASRLIASWIAAVRTPSLGLEVVQSADHSTSALLAALHPQLGVDGPLAAVIDQLVAEVLDRRSQSARRQPVQPVSRAH